MSGRYLRSCLGGFGILSALYLLQAGLGHAGLHGAGRLLNVTLLGIVGGLGLYFLLRGLEASRELRRRRRHEERISQLNHHIRNALQVVVNQAELGAHSAPALRDIENAVNRIDWALREFLPSGTAVAGSLAAISAEASSRPLRHPCPGVYCLYVPAIQKVTRGEPSKKLVDEDEQAQTSVFRNKSA